MSLLITSLGALALLNGAEYVVRCPENASWLNFDCSRLLAALQGINRASRNPDRTRLSCPKGGGRQENNNWLALSSAGVDFVNCTAQSAARRPHAPRDGGSAAVRVDVGRRTAAAAVIRNLAVLVYRVAMDGYRDVYLLSVH